MRSVRWALVPRVAARGAAPNAHPLPPCSTRAASGGGSDAAALAPTAPAPGAAATPAKPAKAKPASRAARGKGSKAAVATAAPPSLGGAAAAGATSFVPPPSLAGGAADDAAHPVLVSLGRLVQGTLVKRPSAAIKTPYVADVALLPPAAAAAAAAPGEQEGGAPAAASQPVGGIQAVQAEEEEEENEEQEAKPATVLAHAAAMDCAGACARPLAPLARLPSPNVAICASPVRLLLTRFAALRVAPGAQAW